MAKDAPLFLLFVFSVIAIATGLGWLLTRWQVLPGTTAVWGSSPGAASAMNGVTGRAANAFWLTAADNDTFYGLLAQALEETGRRSLSRIGDGR